MTEFYCSCGFWNYSVEAFGEHLKKYRNHYRVNKTKWKKIAAGGG